MEEEAEVMLPSSDHPGIALLTVAVKGGQYSQYQHKITQNLIYFLEVRGERGSKEIYFNSSRNINFIF